MRFSVVINTYNRAASLAKTLDGLLHQTHTDFEVVVVNGPSDDGTAELLEQRRGAVRAVDCAERNLAVSRNLGIDAASGDVVAFIDDDAVPEARWLENLAAAYENPHTGGAGGLTLDHTGTRVQYRYSICDRIGHTDFDRTPPFDALNRLGADPFLYLQGTNCSFRRDALVAAEGFDEEIEYNYDESEICSRIIDSGLELRALADAVVHHRFLPSHMRRKEGFTDPFLPIKNRVYFALRVGREHRSTLDTLNSLTEYVADVKAWMLDAVRLGHFTPEEHEHFEARADAGLALGLQRGLAGVRKGREIAEPRPDDFLPYPVLAPEGRRLAVCFVSLDYPPKPLGGIGRFTHDLARGFAAAGHEAHVVTRDDEHEYRTDFEDGVWVHRFPVSGRWVPELDGHPLKGNLEHAAAVHSAVERVAERIPLDVVSGSLWVAEPLLCALDPRWATSVACNTPMRKVAELQPETAAAPLTPHQIRLEDALLRSPATLQPVSEENARLVVEVTDKPLEVIWHGVEDRRAAFPRTRAEDDGAVEILFAGRLEPRKGIDTLLEAATALLRDEPAVRLTVLGGDNPHANGRPDVFRDRVAEHAVDVADRIRFAGHVSDQELYAAYADCDVFCAPSRYESFGLVQVEAMMMGRPVVACDVGGMRETVIDGETGRLVAPGDVEALRAALVELVSDAELRERMGAAGRARYEHEFRNAVAVERNVALYTQVTEELDARGRPAAEDAASATRDALATVLADLCDLDPDEAGSAATALLERHRFPVDLEAGVRAALVQADAGFVTGVFRTILGRDPGEDGLHGYVDRIAAGGHRLAVVHEVATSIEAGGRKLDLRFLDDLPAGEPNAVLRDIGRGWLDDDDTAFAETLHRVLTGDVTQAQTTAARLASGASRAEVAAELLARPSVRSHVETLGSVDVSTLQTEAQLVESLRALQSLSDTQFLEGAYRAILGRSADEGGLAGYVGLLRSGRARSAIVLELATSDEAAGRGFTPKVAHRLADEVTGHGWVSGARRARQRAARARELATGNLATQAALKVAIADAEVRMERTVQRADPQRQIEEAERRLAQHVDEAIHTSSQNAALLSDGLAVGFGRTERDQHAADENAAVLSDCLATGFGRIERHQRAADAQGREVVTSMRWALERLREQIDVMARKHEAMAMDVRDKLPAASVEQAPEPVVPDPDALAASIEAIGGLKLNLGCGEKPLDGYVNVDFRPLAGVDVVADVVRLPFEPGTAQEIASHHLIEHFREHHAETVLLPYWRSLLAPDGVLRVVTPNWEVLIEHLLDGRLTFQQFKQVTFGLQDYSGDDHFAMYSPATLTRLVEAAGFTDVEILTERRQNGLSPELELVAQVD